MGTNSELRNVKLSDFNHVHGDPTHSAINNHSKADRQKSLILNLHRQGFSTRDIVHKVIMPSKEYQAHDMGIDVRELKFTGLKTNESVGARIDSQFDAALSFVNGITDKYDSQNEESTTCALQPTESKSYRPECVCKATN